MKYVLYHSGIDESETTINKLRKHAENGEIVAEYIETPSSTEKRPQLQQAVSACKANDAMLLIFGMSVIGDNYQPIKEEGVRLKVLT